MKIRNHSIIGRLLLTVFTITYFFSCIFIFWLLCLVMRDFKPVSIIIISLVFLLFDVLLWSYLYVLFSIPQRLARDFDKIKNDIASGGISSPASFSSALCDFLVKFYTYSFFDIELAVVKIKDTEPCFSSPELKNCLEWESTEAELKKKEELLEHGSLMIGKKRYHAYSVPIIFGEKFLGFFTVFSSGKLSKLYRKFLLDLENDYVDDQLIHVLRKEV